MTFFNKGFRSLSRSLPASRHLSEGSASPSASEEMEECLMSSTGSSKFDSLCHDEACQTKPDPEGEHSSDLMGTTARPSVQFAEETQLYHYEGVNHEEHADVWYERAEYAEFRRDVAEQAARIENRDRREGSWSNALITAYLAIRERESVEEILQALSNIQVEIDEEHVGIEKFAVPSITRDSLMLSKHLKNHIDLLQEATREDGVDRAELIADSSRTTSRSSRLFAQYAAQLAAGSP